MTDAERRSAARGELAADLSKSLQFALGTGLLTEAALIAKLIESVITNDTNALLLKLKTKPDA